MSCRPTVAVSLGLALVLCGAFSAAAQAAEWQPHTPYATGALVTYQGPTYRCLQAHTSLPGWEPNTTPALWQLQSGTPGPTATPTPLSNTPRPTPTPTSGGGNTPTPTRTPTPTPGGSAIEITPGASGATASANDGNVPGNAVDNNTGTRWSAMGDGQWLRLDLGTTRTVAFVTIAFYNGRSRRARFDVQVSSDGAAWSNVLTNVQGSGTGTSEETFDFADVSTRYVRYLGHGNSVNTWNSLIEISVFGTPGTGTPRPTPTVTPTSPNPVTPTPTVTPTRAATATPTPCGNCGGNIPRHAIVGYWHNFDNGSGFLKLRDVSSQFDVIQVAFAEPTNVTSGDIRFVPYSGTSAAEIRSDIQILRSRGKKVLISIGGANGQVQLRDAGARANFVSSVTSIIRDYGFDGLDIDFEGHSLLLTPGDADFRNPTTEGITNLISAIRAIKSNIGGNFVLTMAPETFFVQLGYQFYGGQVCGSCDTRAGAYLPVIHALRNDLTLVHVQHYNSGPILGLDNQYHFMGSADFHVAMADMLLTGFPVAATGFTFPPLRQDQVAIGLPANVNAGGGFTPVGEVHTALNYLYKGQSFGAYRLRGASSYPNMRGLMTWSINWDRFNNFEFSTQHGNYLDALP